MRTALRGFEKTGIWPPNKNIFPESYYLPSDTTDIPMQALPSEPEQLPAVQDANRPDETEGLNSYLHTMPSVDDDRQYGGNAQTIENSESYRPQVDEQQPSCSFWNGSIPSSNKNLTTPSRETSFKLVSPILVLPIPKVSIRGKYGPRTTRKKGKAVVITESPYKNELEEEKRKKYEQINKKKEKAMLKLVKKNEKQIVSKRTNKSSNTVMREESKEQIKKTKKSSNKRIKEENKVKITRHINKRVKKCVKYDYDSSDNGRDDEAECLYCGDFHSKSIEGWIS